MIETSLRIQLTERLEAHGFYEIEFDFENAWDYSHLDLKQDYRIEIEYAITKNFSLIGNYDADHRGGGGVRFRF